MELLRHSFPNWFVWALIIVLVAMIAIRKLLEVERESRARSEAIDKANERREAAKLSYQADERKRTEVRRLHKAGRRTADIAHQLKISTDLVRLHIRSEDSLDISIAGAFATMRELREIASHGKSRLHQQDRPIVEADVEKLLNMLADAQQRIDDEMDSIVAKRDDGLHDDEFKGTIPIPSQDEHIKIERTSSLPQEIIDLTLAAAKNGAKGANVLYELVVAEMDVGVARFYVTWDTLDTGKGWKKAPAWLTHYLAEQTRLGEKA